MALLRKGKLARAKAKNRMNPSIYTTQSLDRMEKVRQQKGRRAQRILERLAQLRRLRAEELPDELGPDPGMARVVLAALEAGVSMRRLETVLRERQDPEGRAYPHSRQWLAARHADGSLREWAAQDGAAGKGQAGTGADTRD